MTLCNVTSHFQKLERRTFKVLPSELDERRLLVRKCYLLLLGETKIRKMLDKSVSVLSTKLLCSMVH